MNKTLPVEAEILKEFVSLEEKPLNYKLVTSISQFNSFLKNNSIKIYETLDGMYFDWDKIELSQCWDLERSINKGYIYYTEN